MINRFSKKNFQAVLKSILNGLFHIYNLFRKNKTIPLISSEIIKEITTRSLKESDISDHLLTLFVESLEVNPQLIVELGVRGGESTFVFERVAKLSGAKLVSVDIKDCVNACQLPGWFFIKEDDIRFAKKFKEWCGNRGINGSIDILFIDTSHLFEHTLQEINNWLPYLSEKARVFFHDSNLRKIYFRNDGSLGVGWNNERGVIRALEKFFGANFVETGNFVDFRKGWLIEHFANCCGLTILKKIKK